MKYNFFFSKLQELSQEKLNNLFAFDGIFMVKLNMALKMFESVGKFWPVLQTYLDTINRSLFD